MKDKVKYGEDLQQLHLLLLLDFKRGSGVSQDGLELLIPLPSPPQCGNHRSFPYHTSLYNAGSQTQGFILASKPSTTELHFQSHRCFSYASQVPALSFCHFILIKVAGHTC